jgi:hypothetical protein
MRFIWILLVYGCVAIAGCATPPPEELYVEVHGVGLFTTTGVEVYGSDLLHEKTPPSSRTRFLEETRKIPAVLGTQFGAVLTLNSKPSRAYVRLDMVMLTPGMRNPKTGEAFSIYRYSRLYPTGRKVTVGYGFDYEWELVPGSWTLQVNHDGTTVFETEFDVVLP